jgi:flagellar biosynthesis/type III secretory pathway protein FliH
LEKIIGELKEVKTTMQTNNEGTEAVRQFLQVVREQTTKQLPAPELIAHAAEEKAKAEAKSEEQEREIARLRNSALQEYKEKAHQELCRVRDEQKTIGKIKVNTEL